MNNTSIKEELALIKKIELLLAQIEERLGEK